MLVLTACDDASSDSAAPEPAPKIEFTATATNTTTTRTPNAAYQYVTFDIKSDVEVNVKLVLKEKGQPAPTRQEVLDGAGIYRALKTENKSLFLIYDINSKIKEYREALEASGRGMNVIHDDAATALTVSDTGNDTQNVDALLLKQNTAYTLYALQSDGPDTTEVQTLIDLTTREFDSANLPAKGNSFWLDLEPADGQPRLNVTYQIFYDSRDAALIFPSAAMNATDVFSIDISIDRGQAFTSNGSAFASFDGSCFSLLDLDNDYFVGFMSFVTPSFSSTDNASCKESYNNVDYLYQYILATTDAVDDYNEHIIKWSMSYTSSSKLDPARAFYILTKDQ